MINVVTVPSIQRFNVGDKVWDTLLKREAVVTNKYPNAYIEYRGEMLAMHWDYRIQGNGFADSARLDKHLEVCRDA